MGLRKKIDKFKERLSRILTPKKKIRDGSGSFFQNVERVVVNDSNMASVQGDQHNAVHNNTVINIQVDHNTVTQIMSLLSQHIIQGAAHDSSARTPPPRCHPDTRIKLIARITAWFEGQGPQELLLWITGPAGVGKSAIVQTFAEYLAKSKSLGASVFISRPNKRNNPHGIFITIAYQLATRIEAYRNFIVERISLDPESLHRDMEAQFATFIVEPFVERKMGAGGNQWGILLDGLDELQGEDAQCNIIQLISSFVHEHRDTPLVWIIASRSEWHISNLFEDDEVRRSCWTEYVPIDSTEACEGVERFLRSSFKTTQKKFRQSVPSDWPSDTDFLKLTVAASGLFVYAEVVMRFIRDPGHGDPASQLEFLLSVIDRSSTVSTKDNPFVHLDELYHEILSSTPSALWPAAKLLLGFTTHEQQLRDILQSDQLLFGTLRGMSTLFSLSRSTVYACLAKSRSALRIPDWKNADKEKLTFLHASFSDYLKGPNRSADFYVGNFEDIVGVVVPNLIELWTNCSGGDTTPALVESTWLQYCSELNDKRPSSAVTVFHTTLFRDIVRSVATFPKYAQSSPVGAAVYVPLQEVHMIKLCYNFHPEDLAGFVMNDTSHWDDDTQFRREAQLESLKFEHLDWKEMSPAKAYEGQTDTESKLDWILNRPHSSDELEAFISELKDIQARSPDFLVSILGGVPSGRVAVFQDQLGSGGSVYYVIPYPE